MSLTGITFSNQKITPSDDGRLYGSMLSDGILTGCAITFAAATLSIAAGSLLIGTRELRTSGETLSITGATSGYARIIIDIDLTRAATKASFEQAQFQVDYAASQDAFPALEQQDINTAGTHYQAAFCVVSLGEAGITGVVSSLGAAQVPAGRIPTSIPGNAGAHNAIYRGQNLGSAVTAAQWAAIEAGTFEDLFIGDYWTINGVNWRIAAFDYYLTQSDTAHHVLIVPDTSLYTAKMNASSTTSGGYAGSQMRTTNLAQAKTTINNAFGSDHILTFSESLVNAVSSGAPSGISTYECTVELMTERQVYGNPIFGACAWGSSTVPALNTKDRTQFPLFALNPYMASLSWYWLRDIVSDANFAGSNGATAGYAGASYASGGVRPYFCIKA